MKTREEKIKAMRQKVKLWTDSQRLKQKTPYTPPRYDDVYRQGVEWLNAQDEPAYEEEMYDVFNQKPIILSDPHNEAFQPNWTPELDTPQQRSWEFAGPQPKAAAV